MAVHGIDLGTTYSCIAYVDDVGRPTVLRNLEGADTTPSVVFFESPGNVVVGATAKDSAVLHPDLVVSRVKRDMGQDTPRVRHGRPYTPEEISAFILRKLADDAATATGETVEEVVITVPAYFGAAERDATRKAGQIAGLQVIDIISEPIAAAITYGVLNPDQDRTILVYDLGGGTFDTTVMRIEGGDIEVVCTDGDHELGGADWDDRLAEHLAERFRQEHPDAGDPLLDKHSEQQLRRDAEDLKKTLSTRAQHTVRVMHEGRVSTVELTRAAFEELTRDLLDRTIEITRRTMETAAGKGVSSYDHVVLVGGSTKMPTVTETLQKEFQLTPRLQDPDLAVAKGAALYAFEETYRRLLRAGEPAKAQEIAARAGLTAEQQEQIAGRTIKTVASRAFGIVVTDKESRRRSVEHLVHANDALPAGVTQDFYTIDAGQTGVTVEVVEQAGTVESDDPEDNGLIAEGVLKIPPGKPAGWPIEVTFALDASGLLQVTARERETGEELELRIQIGGMSEEDVAESRAALSRVQVS
ncbi:molecular chaperone DnaK [Sphaerisporangium melleum]|uniref:Molecular chaperone DnaK n=1 Tax=Sphaerisporangium melleum TaxID=321316 RepID=A0A917R4F7_9ACTN|nr:Hsp70 family protein [Sphaerisporangium melleum]GGK88451.1 molecular chaperone DnaK [Sphaerisporangium melleum]GII67683.1 molecular chaperone DnaK [Sphaerisporangium melleum]